MSYIDTAILGLIGSVVIIVLWGAVIFNYERSKKRYEKIQKQKSIWEHCISCGEVVYIEKKEPIKNRFYYVEGAGQMCEKCYDYTYRTK